MLACCLVRADLARRSSTRRCWRGSTSAARWRRRPRPPRPRRAPAARPCTDAGVNRFAAGPDPRYAPRRSDGRGRNMAKRAMAGATGRTGRRGRAAREWWRDAVIYQVYPRSFQDTTGSGTGDLRGITRRLPHIASLGADAVWLSPVLRLARPRHGLRRVGLLRRLARSTARSRTSTTSWPRRTALGLRVIIDQVLSHSSDQHPWFAESRAGPHQRQGRLVRLGRPEGRRHARPTTGCRSSAAPPGTFDPRRRQYYLHNFLTEQPDLNFHNPEVVDAHLASMRFWLERGVDGFRLDTVNFFVHDAQLRDNPPSDWTEFPRNPYEAQDHQFSKTQEENLEVLRRMRALTDEFGDIMMVGEVGEAARQIDIMAAYTSGGDKLHMAYSFEFLSHDHTAAHFR